MKRHQRKTAPKVKNGRVQKKDNRNETPNYWNTRQKEVVIDIEKPGKDHKHFLKKRDIQRFLNILPNWDDISEELDAIVLCNAQYGCDGWYQDGVIGICAWEKNQTVSWEWDFFEEHRALIDRIGVKYEKQGNLVVCYFTPPQIQAYQLLHVLLHELGHHHDRINTKSREDSSRGEDYAEGYAFYYEKEIWHRYFEHFQITW